MALSSGIAWPANVDHQCWNPNQPSILNPISAISTTESIIGNTSVCHTDRNYAAAGSAVSLRRPRQQLRQACAFKARDIFVCQGLAFNCSPCARRAPLGRACSLGYACHSSCGSGRLRSGGSCVLVRASVTQPPSCPHSTTRRAAPTHQPLFAARSLHSAVHFGRPLLTRTLRDARSSLFVNESARVHSPPHICPPPACGRPLI